MKQFSELGIHVPEILLPSALDTESWPVIACDQYTQDRNYWKEVAARVGTKPSTLRAILPEVYLNDGDRHERIEAVRSAMREYLSGSVFAPPRRGFVYVERKTAFGRTRKGLVAAIDLDAYEWKPFSTALVRATEATIVERIPPRMEIRRGALLELPHVMLLANDAARSFVEAVGARAKAAGAERLYDGALMMNGGAVSGWAVESPELLELARGALERLAAENQAADGSTFLFAVGDGNHSLATAKAVWEERKAERAAAGASAKELADDPVRYALVEIVNIYDDGLTFEPIHRVFFHADAAALISRIAGQLGGTAERVSDAESLERRVRDSAADFGFVFQKDGAPAYILLRTAAEDLAAAVFQPAADAFIAERSGVEVDYIHGAAEVFRLGAAAGTVGVLLPPVAKDSFFQTVGRRGPLPRKSFSMGEADEKRFYLECRRLFG